jgi:hypothetical protein
MAIKVRPSGARSVKFGRKANGKLYNLEGFDELPACFAPQGDSIFLPASAPFDRHRQSQRFADTIRKSLNV